MHVYKRPARRRMCDVHVYMCTANPSRIPGTRIVYQGQFLTMQLHNTCSDGVQLQNAFPVCSTRIRTGVARFRVWSANHYTIPQEDDGATFIISVQRVPVFMFKVETHIVHAKQDDLQRVLLHLVRNLYQNNNYYSTVRTSQQSLTDPMYA